MASWEPGGPLPATGDAAAAEALRQELQQVQEAARLFDELCCTFATLRLATDTPSAQSACARLHQAARDLRAAQARLLPLACPPLQDFPTSVLQRILLLAGPHTRRVCKQFRAAHPEPPAALRPRAGDGTTPMLAPIHTLPCLSRATALDLSHLPRLKDVGPGPTPPWQETAARLVQAATALQSFTLGPSHYLDDPPALSAPLLAALCQRGPTLRSLSCNVSTSAQAAPLLAALTGLRALHLPTTTQFRPHIWDAMRALPLTRLHLGAFGECEPRCTTHIIPAVARLPHLVDLRLPATMVWHPDQCAPLSTMTRLRALRVGGAPLLISNVHAACTLAALTGLTHLEILDPMWLPSPHAQPAGSIEALLAALRPLSLSVSFVHNTLGFGPALEHAPWNQALALMAAAWTRLTHLELGGAHDAMLREVQDAEDFDPEDDDPEGWLFYAVHLWLNPRTLQRLASTLQSLRLWRVLVPRGLFGLLARGGLAGGLRRLAVLQCCYRGTHQDAGFEPVSGMYGESDLYPMRFFGLRGLTALTELAFDDHLESTVGSVYGQHHELPFLKQLQVLEMPCWTPDLEEELWALLPLQQLRELTLGDVDGTHYDDTAIGLQASCRILRHLEGLVHLTCQTKHGRCTLSGDDVRRLGAVPA